MSPDPMGIAGPCLASLQTHSIQLSSPSLWLLCLPLGLSCLPFSVFPCPYCPVFLLTFDMFWDFVLYLFTFHCTLAQSNLINSCGLICHLILIAFKIILYLFFIKVRHAHEPNQGLQKVYEKNSIFSCATLPPSGPEALRSTLLIYVGYLHDTK